MELKSLLDHPSKLPTIPKITQQLIQSFNSDDVSNVEIVRQLTTDPVLSAKVLRLANSAYFHVSRTIGTVDDALRMLGFVMVRNLVLGNGVVTAFRNTPGMDLKQFWLYNLYTATASRWLAKTTGANADLSFTLGLMHGIGQLQMHVAMPDKIVSLDKVLNVLDPERAALEKQLLGYHYGDVSAELAHIWHFPPSLIEALRDIPQPLSAPAFSAPAGLAHMGAWRARTEVLGMTDEEVVASYPAEVGKLLGLSPAWVPALADQYEGSVTPVMPPLKELSAGLEAMIG